MDDMLLGLLFWGVIGLATVGLVTVGHGVYLFALMIRREWLSLRWRRLHTSKRA